MIFKIMVFSAAIIIKLLKKYGVLNQEIHHQTKTFREEYLDILRKVDIDFEAQYLFEFYE